MKTRPNILFVFADQHRSCDIACSGNPDVQTPALDAFATEAACFPHTFSESPLCVPARGTLLTGLLATGHGAIGNDLPIRPDVESIAHVLRRGGYRTGYIGKWHLAGVPRDQSIPPGPARLGFDTWKVANCKHRYLDSFYDDEEKVRHPITGYEPFRQTDMAVDFLRQAAADSDRPWALWLSYGPPHDPYSDVPAEWLARYDASTLALRPNVRLPACRSAGVPVEEPELRSSLRGYYAHISALDFCFGKLREALDATGQGSNTIVIYTSDHGDQLGSHGWMNKQLPYDESARVPLMMRWPAAIRPGRRDNALVGLADLAPTLAAACGLEFTTPRDGIDLGPLFQNPAGKIRDSLYLHDLTACHQSIQRGTTAWRAIRTRHHLLTCRADRTPWLAFDLRNDPLQMDNRAECISRDPVWSGLFQELDGMVRRHDAWLEPEPLIQQLGLTDAWNKSQLYFGLPDIPAG